MMKSFYLYCIVLLIALPGPQAYAQVRRDRVEKITTKSEIAVSKDHLNRDLHELDAFKNKTIHFQQALITGDIIKIETLYAELLKDMDTEIEQSKRKTKTDKREVIRSEREINNSKKDHLSSRKDMAGKQDSRFDNFLDLRDDKRDTKDDIKDLKDDQRDLASQANRLRSQIEIRNKFAACSYQTEGPVYIETSSDLNILKLFIQTMNYDIQATKEELSEDKAELKEDRRELFEDRRERREKK